MASRKATQRSDAELLNELINLTRDSLITNLSIAGLGQREIREIVGGDIYRVARVAKYFKRKKE